MQRLGLLNPITITRNNVLVAGGRRLEAAKRLGWHTIDARIIETADSTLEMEIEENLQRRDFSPEEFLDASKKLNKLKHPGFFRRIWNALKKLIKKTGLFR